MVSFKSNASHVVLGQEVTITCKLKNTSGASIKYWSVHVGIFSGQFTGSTGGKMYGSYVVGSDDSLASTSWANGATKTFTWTVAVPTSAASLYSTNAVRAVPLLIDYTVGSSKNNLGGDTYVAESVMVLEKFHAPAIDVFEVYRALEGSPNDESDKVLTNIKLSQADGSENNASWEPECKLRFAPVNSTESVEIDLLLDIDGITIAKLLAGIANNDKIITDAILPEYEYNFTLSYGDIYETAVKRVSVSNAFANFALSETGAGASFGMFPTGTADEPKLESAYPGYFYAGIVDFGGGEHCTASQRAMGVQSGALEQITGVDGGKYSDTTVTFPQAFKDGTVPVVIAGFRTSSASSAFGNCACSVHTVSNTGFIVRFYNGDTTKRAPGFNWIAIGQA